MRRERANARDANREGKGGHEQRRQGHDDGCADGGRVEMDQGRRWLMSGVKGVGCGTQFMWAMLCCTVASYGHAVAMIVYLVDHATA